MNRITFFNTKTSQIEFVDVEATDLNKTIKNLKRRKTVDAHSIEVIELEEMVEEVNELPLTDEEYFGKETLKKMLGGRTMEEFLDEIDVEFDRSDDEAEITESGYKVEEIDVDRDEKGFPAIDSIWLTKRNGDFYRVVEHKDGKAKLRWMEGSYSRWVPFTAFEKNYVAAKATWNEGFDLVALKDELR